MHVKVTKKYGLNAQVEIVADNTTAKDGLGLLSFLLQPDYCGKCKSTKVTLDSNVANTDEGQFVYLKRKCLNPGCGAQSTLGENKGGKGYFWKEWEIYKAKAGDNTPILDTSAPAQQAPAPKADSEEEVSLEDIPF